VSRSSNHWSRFFCKGLGLGMGMLLVVGCDRLPPLSKFGRRPTPEPAAQDLLCDTPNYLAQVTNPSAQPNLSFGPKPAMNFLSQGMPVSITENPDGSRTYAVHGESITYARFYPDNTCLVQVVAADGSITMEESGQTNPLAIAVSTEAIASSDLEQPDRYQQGYDLGYRDGYQSGIAARQENRENNPDRAFPVDVASGNESYDRGYREGFYDGFDGGYDSFISQEPDQAALSLSCSGTIDNQVDFTAYYTHEVGFNRIDFKPRESSQTLTANLSYDRKNEQNYGVWRGNVAQMADVILIHESTDSPKSGDGIAVSYDNRWGRANCR